MLNTYFRAKSTSLSQKKHGVGGDGEREGGVGGKQENEVEDERAKRIRLREF